jgi:23S rRNA pseudouridine2457 synthase
VPYKNNQYAIQILSNQKGLSAAMILIFNKPYGVLSQFTEDGSANRTLSEFGLPKDVYAIGRLDADSEGMLLLSDEPGLNTQLLDPKHAHTRCYWAQVENIPTPEALEQLSNGVFIKDYKTMPARAWMIDPQPNIAAREPPIRIRLSIPDCWIGLELIEGKNRQVRKMTAAVGHPTLRLMRVSMGTLQLGDLASGSWVELIATQRNALFF